MKINRLEPDIADDDLSYPRIQMENEASGNYVRFSDFDRFIKETDEALRDADYWLDYEGYDEDRVVRKNISKLLRFIDQNKGL